MCYLQRRLGNRAESIRLTRLGTEGSGAERKGLRARLPLSRTGAAGDRLAIGYI